MRTVIRIVLLGLSAAILSAASPVLVSEGTSAATGKGSMTFGHDEEGVGFFEFNVSAGAETTGKLLFAAEHHHHYPDIIVRVRKIDRARFGPGWVKFSATGALHDETVRVRGGAWDGAATGKPDRFSIRCTNGTGEVVLEAEGHLFRGDIVVGAAE
ncbi:MAG: hypothetical protein ACYTF4_17720 [Planctomycetota bacterium]|jgi:hypothetical protein